MLQYSSRLVVVTLDAEGKVIDRKAVSPRRSYECYEHEQLEADAKKVHLEPNQRVEVENFIDTSRYEAGWRAGLIF